MDMEFTSGVLVAFIIVQGLAMVVGYAVARKFIQKRAIERSMGVHREI